MLATLLVVASIFLQGCGANFNSVYRKDELSGAATTTAAPLSRSPSGAAGSITRDKAQLFANTLSRLDPTSRRLIR